MPCILRTVHNSPYYAQELFSHVSTLVRRNDTAKSAAAAVIIILVALAVMGAVTFSWVYVPLLMGPRGVNPVARFKGSAGKWKRGFVMRSRFLKLGQSRKLKRPRRKQPGYERFGDTQDDVTGLKLPVASYVGLWQVTPTVEHGEGYELHECTHEAIKEVQRYNRWRALNESENRQSFSAEVEIESRTERRSGFQPGEAMELFVIEEKEEQEKAGDEKGESGDNRSTFNSDEVPSQWGEVIRKYRDSNQAYRRSSSVPSIISVCNSLFETRIDYSPHSGRRCSSILVHGVTAGRYRHLSDSGEANECMQCKALSTNFQSDLGLDLEACSASLKREELGI